MNTKSFQRFIKAVSALLLATITTAFAGEYYVSSSGNDMNSGTKAQPLATIARGIELATNGDLIWVAAGTYSGAGNCNLNLWGKKVSVCSLNGPETAVINCGGNSKAFIATGAETSATTIDGFKIINGFAVASGDWAFAGIIEMRNGACMTIRNCTFTNNVVSVNYPTASASIISKEEVEVNNGETIVKNCLFFGNTLTGGTISFASVLLHPNGGYWPDRLNYLVENCTIANNTLNSAAYRVPVYLYPGKVSDCIVWQNTGEHNNSAVAGSNGSVSYSMTSSANSPIGTTNMVGVDPLFANAGNNDFSLQASSPARDSGTPTKIDPDGSRLDIGYRADRFEFQLISTLNTQGGTITGAGTYQPSATATLTATPNPGYVFRKWTGDASGTTNPLQVVMDSHKSIGATFGGDTADDDSDGLSNFAEIVTYGCDPTKPDTDGDGFNDKFEVDTGFNPTLASSTPDALSTIRTAVEFRFNAATGLSYRIEASTDLNQWDVIEPVIIGQSAVVTRFYSIENQPKRYFRVRRN